MFGQSLLSAFGIACTTDTDQLFIEKLKAGTEATYQLNSNADSLNIAGKLNGCGAFNGSSSYITATVSHSDTFSISAWVYPTSHNDRIYYQATQDSSNLIQVGQSTTGGNGTLVIANKVSNSWNVFRTTSEPLATLNQWYNIVVNFSSSDAKIYVNGSFVESHNVFTSTPTYTTAIIGAANTGSYNSFWDGKLNQLRIFGSALTASQVTDLYNETTSTASTLNYPTTATALYQLDGNATDTGGNYNGTATNVTWAYNGTATNITYAPGKIGNAAVFNGSNSKIIANGKPLNNNTSITISFWARNFNAGDWVTVLGEGGSGGGTPGYKIYSHTNNYLWIARANSPSGYVFDTYDSGQPNNGGIDFGVDGNTWVHCAFTVSPTQLIMYKNAVSVKSLSISNTSTVGSTYDFQFMFDGEYSRYLQGELDQVRLFDTTLSQAAVTALYNETATTAAYNYIDYEQGNSIAYYKMENATDQLGNYNGTATNVNFNTEGKFGFAGGFNGTNSNIEFSAGAFTNTTMSFSGWIYSTSNASDQNIFSNFDYISSVSKGFIFRKNAGGALEVQLYDNSGSQTSAITTETVTNNTWTHVVLTVDTTGANIYINSGTPKNLTASNPMAFHTATTRAGIGSYRYTGSSFEGFFDGKLDQIRIYDEVLSASEVSTLYNEVYCQPTAIVGTNFYNTVLYTGTSPGTQSVNTVGFKPDFVWIKGRDEAYNHVLTDSVRGVSERINSNTTSAESDWSPNGVSAFNTAGFNVTAPGGQGYGVNQSGIDYVSWNWKAGGTAVSNTDGTVTSTVSANVNAGFSIVQCTSPSSTINFNCGHGLSKAPELVFVKTTSIASYWEVIYPNDFSSSGSSSPSDWNRIKLNEADAKMSSNAYLAADSTKIYNGAWGANTALINYCFTSIPGYSKIGSYVGQTAGITIYTGFQPRFIMVKSTSNVENWAILDAVRGSGKCLNPNTNSAESDSTLNTFTTTATGFSFPHQNTADAMLNENGYEYIFLAIA